MNGRRLGNQRDFGGGGFRSFFRQLTPGVKYLLIFLVIVFMAQVFVSRRGISPLVLTVVPELVLQGKLWQFFTATFIYTDAITLLFALLSIYFSGTAIESLLGTKRFVRFFILGGMATHILAFIFIVLLGKAHFPGPISTGTAVAFGSLIGCYATLFWNETVRINFVPLRGKTLLWIGVGLCIFLMLQGDLSCAGPLCGLFVGYLYIRKSHFKLYQKLESAFNERLRLWRIRRKYRNFRVMDAEVKELWDDLEDRLNDDTHNKHIH